jgi:RNA polymerase II subunit A C-terminal domain phosphatase SSU72
LCIESKSINVITNLKKQIQKKKNNSKSVWNLRNSLTPPAKRQAHFTLTQEHNYDANKVYSYGTGNAVRLPGPTPEQQNVFAFGTPYSQMLENLTQKDAALYEKLGVVAMLERNVRVKPAPQRFQDERDAELDVIVTFETRVFDAVVEHLSNRDSTSMKVVHVFGLHIKDNAEAALVGGQNTVLLLSMLADRGDWENHIAHVLEEFQQRSGRQVLHAVLFF